MTLYYYIIYSLIRKFFKYNIVVVIGGVSMWITHFKNNLNLLTTGAYEKI